MKKIKLLKKILIMGMVLTTVFGTVATQASERIVRVVVNGEPVTFPDAKAFLDKNNRTMVPVRFVSEELGAKVNWTRETQEVNVFQGDSIINLKIGQKQMTISGSVKQLDTAAIIKGGRTFVPLRFVSEALGAKVEWDPKGSVAYINNNGQPIVKNDIYTTLGGFTIPITEDCKVFEDSYSAEIRLKSTVRIQPKKQLDEGATCILNILADIHNNNRDYKSQLNDIEAFLSQQLSSSTMSKIMNQLNRKVESSVDIGDIDYYDGPYRIRVVSRKNNASINIQIHYK